MFDFLNKLNIDKGMRIFGFIFGNLIAPYWFLFQFFRPLVSGTNYIQQLIICLAIGIPITLFAFAGEVIAVLKKEALVLGLEIGFKKIKDNLSEKDMEELTNKMATKLSFKCLYRSCITAAFVLYFPCILYFFVPINSHTAIICSMMLYIVLIFAVIIKGMSNESPKKQKN